MMYSLLFLLGILILLGFFAGIEIAFVSANKLSVELKKKQGKRSSVIISQLLEDPYLFVGICIIGYGMLLVVYGLLVSNLLDPFWKYVGMQQVGGSEFIKSVIEILVAVSLVLIFEFLFRAIFRSKSDTLLGFFGFIMQGLQSLLKPVLQLFGSISVWILKYLFNLQIDEKSRAFNRIDLEHYYQQTKESGEETQELNQELFENALSISGIKVRTCLVPRTEVIGLPASSSIEDVRKKLSETKLSRLIIYDGNIDNITGYVHQNDLLKNKNSLDEILLPIPTIPETMNVTDLITKFSKDRKSIAWVVDEFGGTAGIVTMEDLLEEIFGDIRDEYDTEEMVDEKISDHSFMLSGRLELDDLREKYQLSFEGDAETLSGYIIKHHQKIPKEKEKIIIGKYQFDIIAMSDARIEQVKLSIL